MIDRDKVMRRQAESAGEYALQILKLEEEIARLTERCDAYREALKSITDEGKSKWHCHDIARAALASAAQEQKDKP